LLQLLRLVVFFILDLLSCQDEVLVAMAEQLGNMVAHVGGNDFAYALLPPLARLAAVEEASVRDAAVAALVKVVRVLPPRHADQHWLPALQSLTTHDYFTARVSACSLCGIGLSQLAQNTPSRASAVVETFAALCKDDTPMVRRVAAAQFASFAGHVARTPDLGESSAQGSSSSDDSDAASEPSLDACAQRLAPLLPLLLRLSTDEQDSVRLQCASAAVGVAQLLATAATAKQSSGEAASDLPGDGSAVAAAWATWEEKHKEAGEASASSDAASSRLTPLEAWGQCYGAAVTCGRDAAWRVRWSCAKCYADLMRSFGPSPPLIELFEQLLADSEPEVRVAACGAVSAVGAQVGLQLLLSRVLPAAARQADDVSEEVRASLALSLAGLSPSLGQSNTIAHLLPLLLRLLRDAHSQVRLNIVAELHAVNATVGVDLLAQSLLPTVLELARDGKWRVRLAVLQHMPALASQLGQTFFSDQLLHQCIAWLHDDVFTVRAAAAKNLEELATRFGPDWAVGVILPPVLALAQRGSAESDGSGGVCGAGAMGVAVPEHPSAHRLTAVRALACLAPCLGAEGPVRSSRALQHVVPPLAQLCRDPIPNVRFSAAKALAELVPLVGRDACAAELTPVFAAMQQDPDRDVQFFAARAATVL